MRHRYKLRQLNRSPRHRASMIKTMCTQLVEHERIHTTLAKAKELRPYMEKLIHRAKRLTPEDHLYLAKNLRTSAAIKKIKTEIAPRFRKLPAGFTRVEYTGKRVNDKAPVGRIEIMGNEYQEMRRNKTEQEKDSFDLQTFWQWEAKICEQEVDYYEKLLRDLKSQIDGEIADRLAEANLEDVDPFLGKKKLTGDQRRSREIAAMVEDKYAEKKQFLVRGYERAKTEESVHLKQKDHRKYEKMFEIYAYPINFLKLKQSDKENIIAS